MAETPKGNGRNETAEKNSIDESGSGSQQQDGHKNRRQEDGVDFSLDSMAAEQAKESAIESAIEDNVYEKIIVSTPDIVRDIVKDLIVEKYVQDLDDDGTGATSAQADGAEGSLQRSSSHPSVPSCLYPDVQHASDINVPGGFRRDFIRSEASSDDLVPEAAQIPFLKVLLQDNSSTLYAWVEEGLDSDEEDDNDFDNESLETGTRSIGTRRYRMVFSSYNRASIQRRDSEFANDESIKTGNNKTVVTLFKCFVATGIMFLPSGFKNAGLVAGTFTLLFIGAISFLGITILIKTRAFIEDGPPGPRTPLLSSSASAAVSSALFPRKPLVIQSYSQLGQVAVGHYGKRMVQTSILFSQVGFCCVYISFIGNTLSQTVSKNFLDGDGTGIPLWAYILLTIPFVTPLTFIRHLKHFNIPNSIANVFVLSSIGILLAIAAVHIADPSTKEKQDWSCSPDDLSGTACFWINTATYPMFLGSSVYVFEGITMVIPIQNSMKNPESLPHLLKWVMLFVTLMFVSFGALNFYAYAQDIQPIVIDNLPKESGMIVTIMFVFVALFMFPLMAFPAARIVEKRLFKKLRRSGYKWQKNFIRTCIVLFCVAISIGAGTKVDKMVAVIGGMFCVPLALVYPPLFFIKSGCARDFWTELVPAGVLFVIGTVAAIMSTTIAIIQF